MDAHRRPRVLAGLPKHGVDQVGRGVGDLALLREVGGRLRFDVS